MSEVDGFGIKMIYPTNAESNCAKPWFLGIDDWDSRADGWVGQQSINEEGNLQYNVKLDGDDIKTRFKIQALPGQDEVTETRQDILRDRGFMGTESDWKNVEVTFYARINEKTNSNDNGGPHFEIEARSGVHTGADNRVCEGTALHTNVYPSGRVKLEKELSHTKGYTENDPNNNNATDNLMD
ncbi:MAG TPA: hypothetical protein VFT71_07675, partial [Candidatus Nitrosocosmicus sp.]|nr:hypothetical protein [Candidatus Nitrosocosmicus sp.]